MIHVDNLLASNAGVPWLSDNTVNSTLEFVTFYSTFMSPITLLIVPFSVAVKRNSTHLYLFTYFF